MLSSIKSFQTYLVLLKKNLNTRDFWHFPHLSKFINENPEFKYDLQIFEIEIGNIEKELHARFKDFNNMELILSYIKIHFKKT